MAIVSPPLDATICLASLHNCTSIFDPYSDDYSPMLSYPDEPRMLVDFPMENGSIFVDGYSLYGQTSGTMGDRGVSFPKISGSLVALSH